MSVSSSASRQNNKEQMSRRYFAPAALLIAGILIASAGGLASASSTSTTSNSKFDIDLTVFVPCADGGSGESVHLTGSIHELFHVIDNGKGGFVVKILDNPQGVRGVGDQTGDTYHGTGVTEDILVVQSGTSETSINNFRIIGEGPGNNFAIHSNLHIRVNEDGTVSSYHDHFTVSCN